MRLRKALGKHCLKMLKCAQGGSLPTPYGKDSPLPVI